MMDDDTEILDSALLIARNISNDLTALLELIEKVVQRIQTNKEAEALDALSQPPADP